MCCRLPKPSHPSRLFLARRAAHFSAEPTFPRFTNIPLDRAQRGNLPIPPHRMCDCRARGIRQHEAGDGLPRGWLGRVRCRSRSLSGHDGGPRREGSSEATTALSSAKLPPRASPVRGAGQRPVGTDHPDVHLVDEQLRASQHRFQRNASWSRGHAAPSRRRRPRMGPVPRTVSSAATRQALQAVGRRTGLLRQDIGCTSELNLSEHLKIYARSVGQRAVVSTYLCINEFVSQGRGREWKRVHVFFPMCDTILVMPVPNNERERYYLLF